MELQLTDAARAELETAAAKESHTRGWKRYRAVLLVSAGMAPIAVAQALDCARSSVYSWVASWRAEGVAGLEEGPQQGAVRRRDRAGDVLLEALLADDPQARGYHATGWTVALLQAEVRTAGYELSERTLRRTLHRLGYRWKRPKFVRGRPDPAYAEKKGASARVRR